MKKEKKQERRGRPAGLKLSAKTKKKIALSHIGKKHTEETKRKIGLSVLKYWAIKDAAEVAELNKT